MGWWINFILLLIIVTHVIPEPKYTDIKCDGVLMRDYKANPVCMKKEFFVELEKK